MKYLKITVSAVAVLAFGVFAYLMITNIIYKDDTIPEITMNSELITVKIADPEKKLLEGVTATDGKDGDLTDKIIVESVSRFVEPNVCVVTYAVCDSDNHVVKAKRKVRYSDHHKPRFTLRSSLVYSDTTAVDLRKVIGVKDDMEGDISDSLVITQADAGNASGAYTILLRANNAKGESVSLKIPLYIESSADIASKIRLVKYIDYVKVGHVLNPDDYIVPGQQYDVRTETNYNAAKAGVYQVHYYVTNLNGAVGHTVLNVVVEE